MFCFSWDKKNNPEPWNKLGPNDQYKVSHKVVSECCRVCFHKVCHGVVFLKLDAQVKFHYRELSRAADCSVKLNW